MLIILYYELLFCSRPRALAARVYYVKLLPIWNKDYLSIYTMLRLLSSKAQGFKKKHKNKYPAGREASVDSFINPFLFNVYS